MSAITTVEAVRAMNLGIAAAMGHQHEEGDACSGAENHDGAEHVQIFEV